MNFKEMPEHIRRRHQHDVPSLGSLDDAVLPAAPVHYAEVEIIEPDRSLQPVLDNSSKLDNLTQKALDLFDEILSEPASSDPKELATQMEAAKTIITTQLRVDDSRLKKRQNDTLAELLKRMDEEDERLKLSA